MDIEISMMLKGATSFSVPLFQQFDLDKSFSKICIALFMSMPSKVSNHIKPLRTASTHQCNYFENQHDQNYTFS
jgi:hypothetical protein